MLKFGLMLVFFGRIKIGLVFGFCGCYFIGIGLVLVCHFPENDIRSGVPAAAQLVTACRPTEPRAPTPIITWNIFPHTG